jgi:hypothetical protein
VRDPERTLAGPRPTCLKHGLGGAGTCTCPKCSCIRARMGSDRPTAIDGGGLRRSLPDAPRDRLGHLIQVAFGVRRADLKPQTCFPVGHDRIGHRRRVNASLEQRIRHWARVLLCPNAQASDRAVTGIVRTSRCLKGPPQTTDVRHETISAPLFQRCSVGPQILRPHYSSHRGSLHRSWRQTV